MVSTPATTPLSLIASFPVESAPGAVDPGQRLPGPPMSADVEETLKRAAAERAEYALGLDPHSPAMLEVLQDIERIGDRAVHASADATRPLLWGHGAPLKDNRTAGSLAGKALRDLQVLVDDLDPARVTEPRGLSALIPTRSRIAAYFRRYDSSQGRIDAVLRDLDEARKDIRKGNIAVRSGQFTLWEQMHSLNQAIILVDALDAAVSGERGAPFAALVEAVGARHETLRTHALMCANALAAAMLVLDNNAKVERSLKSAAETTSAATRTALGLVRNIEDTTTRLQQAKQVNAAAEKAARTIQKSQRTKSEKKSMDLLSKAFNQVRDVLDQVPSTPSSTDPLRGALSTLSDQPLQMEPR